MKKKNVSLKKKLTTKVETVYQPLLDDLTQAFEANVIKPGDWLMGENALSKEYGIGHISVRKALAILEKNGRIKRMAGKGTLVLEQAKELKEIIFLGLKSYGAQQLSDGSFYSPIYDRISEFAKEKKIAIKIILHEWFEEPTNFWSNIIFESSTGVLLVGETHKEFLPSRDKIEGPVIQIDHNIKDYKADSVEFDSFGSGVKMVEHLADLGHKKIIYLGWWQEDEVGADRKKGVLQAIKKNKNIELVTKPFGGSTVHGEDDNRSVSKKIQELIKNKIKFTGIVAYDSKIAREAIETLKKADLKVPEDVSVVCVSSGMPLYKKNKTITHFKVDINTMADQAFTSLLWRFENMSEDIKNNYIPVELEEGDSCKRL